MPMQRLPLLLLLAALLLAGCGGDPVALNNGEPAPGFTLNRLDGSQVTLTRLRRGSVVAIRFWADWCPFCEQEMSDLEPVYQRLKGQGFEMLAINVRQDQATVKRFTSRLGISYPVLLDVHGEVARSYAVMGLPTTFFIDRQGVVRQRILGESTPDTFTQIAIGLLQ